MTWFGSLLRQVERGVTTVPDSSAKTVVEKIRRVQTVVADLGAIPESNSLRRLMGNGATDVDRVMACARRDRTGGAGGLPRQREADGWVLSYQPAISRPRLMA